MIREKKKKKQRSGSGDKKMDHWKKNAHNFLAI
jgi:hypothetical protein